MTAWYKKFASDTKADEEEDEAEGAEPKEGYVAAPLVLANGANGAFSLAMSPPPESGDDGGEGADEGEKGAEEETAGEAEAAAAADATAAAAAAAVPAAKNKYTGGFTADP